MFEEKSEKTKITKKPPRIEDVLFKIFQSWHGKKRSAHVPRDNNEAVYFWINNQEPANEYRDRPEEILDRNGQVAGWKTPYHDRLAYNLRQFLALTEIDKAYVLDCIKNGITYRGDDIESLKMIRSEYGEMLKDPAGYKSNAKFRLDQFKRDVAA